MSGRRLVHGNVLLVKGAGVWITGEPGSGKSELSLALVDRGHRMVADDVAWISRQDGRLEARADPAQFGIIHIRDLGLIDLAQLFGGQALCPWVVLDLRIDLSLSRQGARADNPDELLAGRRGHCRILNVSIPCLSVTAHRSRPLALLVECAARQHQQAQDHAAQPRGQGTPLQGATCV